LTLGFAPAAQAFQLEVSNPDLRVSWDTTIRYNIGARVEDQDKRITGKAGANLGDLAYDRGDIVTNRFDVLSEFQMDWHRQYGFRASAAAWYDGAFNNRLKPNEGQTSTYIDDRYSSFTKRYYEGPSAEILEAYGYANFDIGDVASKIKVGRHTVLWGEAVSWSAHSVSYAQAPTDARKAAATPGVDAKEISLPIGQVSGTFQLAPNVNLGLQYLYEWDETRIPEGGTYLSGADFLLRGPERFNGMRNGGMIKPDSGGEGGAALRWSPSWLDGTLGFYARRFSERSFWTRFDPANGVYNTIFPSGTNLYGISLSKNVGGISIGSELVYRTNTALVSRLLPTSTGGARGDTFHAVFNAVASWGQTPLWGTATLTGEIAYSRWEKVTENEALFSKCRADEDVVTGCATKDAWQTFLRFNPSWPGVVPGVDLVGAASLSYGIKGNAAILGATSAGIENVGTWGLGMTADVNARHQVSLNYNGYLGSVKTINNVVTIQGTPDRNWVSLTYKTSF
jgi:hypothetical protein